MKNRIGNRKIVRVDYLYYLFLLKEKQIANIRLIFISSLYIMEKSMKKGEI